MWCGIYFTNYWAETYEAGGCIFDFKSGISDFRIGRLGNIKRSIDGKTVLRMCPGICGGNYGSVTGKE